MHRHFLKSILPCSCYVLKLQRWKLFPTRTHHLGGFFSQYHSYVNAVNICYRMLSNSPSKRKGSTERFSARFIANASGVVLYGFNVLLIGGSFP